MAEVQARPSTLVRKSSLDLKEVSALTVSTGSKGRVDLLAVGDEDFVIARSLLTADDIRPDARLGVRSLLPPELSDASEGSEWEALAVDGAGQVFVLREASATIFVISATLDELRHTIELDVTNDDEWDARLLSDSDAGPEGLVLLSDGHLLVVKQRDPILFVEFGPPDQPAKQLQPGSSLRAEQAFEVSDGSHTKLVARHSWRLSAVDEHELESANDLAIDSRGRLHAISSRSRLIYELASPALDDRTLAVSARWTLPEELKASRKQRKAEGLAFDDDDRVLVAIDEKEKHKNAFLLERLERGD